MLWTLSHAKDWWGDNRRWVSPPNAFATLATVISDDASPNRNTFSCL